MEQDDSINPVTEALKRGGMQGLLAAVPVVAWLRGKHSEGMVKTFSAMEDQELRGGAANLNTV